MGLRRSREELEGLRDELMLWDTLTVEASAGEGID